MLYGNPFLKYFFEFFIESFRLIVFSVRAKIKVFYSEMDSLMVRFLFEQPVYQLVQP